MGSESGTRERILEAACRLFHQRGYQSVSVQDLCESAEVKRGSFYHFFRSKQELALAMIDRQWERARENEFTPCFEAKTPPLERIALFFRGISGGLATARTEDGALCGCPFGNLAVEMAAQDPKLRSKLGDVYREYADFFERALHEATARGEIGITDVRGAAESLVAMTSGIATLAKTHNDIAVADRVADQVMYFLARGDGATVSSRGDSDLPATGAL